MPARILLNAIKKGIHFYLKDGTLAYKAPQGALTPELRQQIVENKNEIIHFLKTNAMAKVIHDPVTKVSDQDHANVLSFAQERLWLLDKIEGNSAHYNMPGSLQLSGKLDYSALQKAFSSILERHESLRTCFLSDEEGRPYQVIQAAREFILPVTDLSAIEPSQQQARITQIINEESARPFNLSVDFMLRGQLLKLEGDEHILLVTMHHIASDGWSMSILINEFSQLYSAYVQGLENPLSALAIQYADYAYWQRNALKGEVLESQLSYWERQLAGLPLVHGLPLDRPRPRYQTFVGGIHKSVIGRELSAAFAQLNQAQGATLFIGLHAAFSVLLARYSNEQDIVVGSPIANREQLEIAPLIGFFVNTLVLRSDLSASPCFSDLLKQSREVLLNAYAHQQVPFEQIVERLQPQRSLSHSALFQVMLVLQNNEEAVLELPGVTLSPVQQQGQVAKYDLTLNVSESEQGLLLAWEYNRDLFDAATIARMAGHFGLLLEGLVAAPEENVFRVKMLDEAERQGLLEWNRSDAAYPDDRCIHELFEAQVARNGEALAVVYENERLSYGELNIRANRLAHYLMDQRGVKPDRLVGICLDRSLDMLVAILAILKAGGAYVPLDPSYPEARLQYLLADARLDTVLTRSDLMGATGIGADAAVCLDRVEVQALLRDYPAENVAVSQQGLTARHLAYVIYTSGSTGNPKGVMVEHTSVVSLVINNNYVSLSNQTVMLQNAPVAFDAATLEIWGPLLNGGRLIVNKSGPVDVQALGEFIKNNGVNTAWMTSGLFDQFVAGYEQPLPELAYFLVGGDVVNKYSVEVIRNRNKKIALINGYGPTENTTFSCCYLIPENINHLQSIPIGKTLANRAAYVLDQYLNQVPVGVVGELYVSGAGLARSYLNLPETTAEKFIANPFCVDATNAKKNDRLYKTGDLVRRLSDGNLEFIGRRDNQVKIRGFRIETGEILNALTAQDIVSDAVVILDSATDKKQLLAYIVPTDKVFYEQGNSLQSQQQIIKQVIANLKKTLPEYLIPHAFSIIDSIPLTENGKIDRKALPAIDISAQIQNNYVPPSCHAEEVFCDIWENLLSIDTVGITDNFFSIGGDSILAIQLVTRAKKKGLSITTRDVYECQTIASLAACCEKNSNQHVNAISQDAVTGQQTLTPIHREFFSGNEIEWDHFNQSAIFNVSPLISSEFLSLAVAALGQRHDVFRLRFIKTEDGHQQQCWKAEYLPLTLNESVFIHEVIPSENKNCEKWLSERCQYWQTQVNIVDGPLWRVVLLESKNNADNYLFIVMHHLITDGFSWRILIQDIERAFQQYVDGKKIHLSDKTTSMQVWGNLLPIMADSKTIQLEKDFWINQFQQDIKPLPQDIHCNHNPVEATTQRISFKLSTDETTSLLFNSNNILHANINELLLAAAYVGIYQYSGQHGLLLTMEGHGREETLIESNLSETIGWFTTTWPLALQCSSLNFETVIKEVKETCRALPNKGIGYGLLRWVACNEDIIQASNTVTPQFVFNYLGQFDQSFSTENNIRISSVHTGENIGGMRQRSHKLGFNAQISDGRLSFVLDFSTDQYHSTTIEKIGGAVVAFLKKIITECESVKGAFTPSDFPLANIDSLQLDSWQSTYPALSNIYPATPMQQGLLFHSMLNNSSYIAQSFPMLSGCIDTNYFRMAWQAVIDRHDILRTIFVPYKDQVLQLVQKNIPLSWHEEDWRHLSSAEQHEKFEKYRLEDKERGFDLAKAPLMRITIFHLAQDRYRLLWSHHHIILDGWCLPVIYREVKDFYTTLCDGKSVANLSGTPYENYIQWLMTQDMSRAQAYWHEQLHGVYEPTPLPLISSINEPINNLLHGEHQFAEAVLTFDKQQTHALHNFAKSQKTTLNNLLQVAWAYLLHIYSGEDRVIFGATISGRPAEIDAIEHMVGLFINTIPVSVVFAGKQSVEQVLAKHHRSFQEAYHHGHLSLSDIQKQSSVANGALLFNSILVFENFPKEWLGRPTDLILDKSQFYIESYHGEARSHYPLTISASLNPELQILCEYRPNEYDENTIKILLQQFQQILLGFENKILQDIHELSLLLPAEKETLLVWEKNSQAYDPLLIHELFERQVEKTPTAIALISNEGQLTYRQLNEKANQLAHYLIASGVTPNTLVGLCSERSLGMVISLLGILKAGAAYVPLDPAYPLERLHYMLKDSDIATVLIQKRWIDKFNGISPAQNKKSHEFIVIDDSVLQKMLSMQSRLNPEILIAEDAGQQALAYVMYTSGSTGQPKGVMISHKGVSNYLQYASYAYMANDIVGSVVSSPLAFDATITSLYVPLCVGAYVELLPENEKVIETIADYLFDDEENLLFKLTPAHLAALANLKRNSYKKNIKVKHVIVIGGEQLSTKTMEPWANDFLPYATFVNEYGPTETVVGCSVYFIQGREGGENIRFLTSSIAIGKPIANAHLYVLSPHLQRQPIGAIGELYIGGDGVGIGYWAREQLSSEKFIHHKLDVEVEKLYCTGDHVRWLADGNLEFLGRIDEQVKIRGFRIELEEIEYQLGQLANIVEASVVSVLNEQRLIAYVVVNDQLHFNNFSEANAKTIKQELSKSLPSFMIPANIIALSTLPLTVNGKVDKKALAKRVIVSSDIASDDSYVAPETEIEKELCTIWQDILKLERVSVQDNFFTIGGDSILSILVIARANQEGISITTKMLYQHQTIAGLVANLDASAVPSLMVAQNATEGTQHLLPAQRWFFTSQSVELNHFNYALLLVPPADFENKLLLPVIESLYKRHDALRLRFNKDNVDNWQAQYIPLAENIVAESYVNDVFSDTTLAWTEWLSKRCDYWQRSLDIIHGPLIKFVHLDPGVDNAVSTGAAGRVLIVIHHLVMDAVSIRILIDDMQRAYEQARDNAAIHLAVKTTSLQIWGDTLKNSEEEVDSNYSPADERSLWLAQHKTFDTVPMLSHLNQDNVPQVITTQKIYLNLTQEESRSLLQECHLPYHTKIEELLLAGVYLGVRNWSGQATLGVMLEGHGRESQWNDIDVSQTLGWFTSLYPLRMHSDTIDIATVIKTIKEQRRAIPNNGFGYGLLLTKDEELKRAAATCPMLLLFNYLGQINYPQAANSFVQASESCGSFQSEKHVRNYSLGMNGQIVNGLLNFTLDYSDKEFSGAAMKLLAQAIETAWRLIINHCLTAEEAFTVSDFPLASVAQNQLDNWQKIYPDFVRLYPATPMQQGIYFHNLMEPETYIVQIYPIINGNLNIELFTQAWQQLVQRNDVMRTVFVGQTDELQQLVLRTAKLQFIKKDWRGLSSTNQDEQFSEYRRQDRALGFQLDEAPLIRISLLQLADNRYRLLWTHHHIIADGWSSPLIYREVMNIYSALLDSDKASSTLLSLPKTEPFENYIHWLQKQDVNQAKGYWREKLIGITQPTPLAIDKLPVDTIKGWHKKALTLSTEQTEQLQHLAKNQKVTLNSVLQLAWAYLLHRYSGQDDIVFGATVSGRPPVVNGVESIIGLFINTIPVRVSFANYQRTDEILLSVQQEFLKSNDYAWLSLAEIQVLSELPGAVPLFDTQLVFANFPLQASLADSAKHCELTIESVDFDDRNNYKLAIDASLEPQLKIVCGYLGEEFSDTTIVRMLEHFAKILVSLPVSIDKDIHSIELRTDYEIAYHQKINNTQMDISHEKMVHRIFEDQVQRTPNAIAISHKIDDETHHVTYAELNAHANQIAWRLIREGICLDDVVAVLTERDNTFLASILGVLKAGGAYLPLDPNNPPARYRQILQQAKLNLVICGDSFAAKMNGALADYGNLPAPNLVVLGTIDLDLHNNTENPQLPYDMDSLSYVIFTSGSTGQPKGAMLTHKGLLNHLLAKVSDLSLNQRSVVAQNVSQCFDISVWQFLTAILVGGRISIFDHWEMRDPVSLIERVHADGVTVLELVPTVMRVLVEEIENNPGKSQRMESLIWVIPSGEAAVLQTCRRWMNLFPHLPLMNAYGPAECTDDVCTYVMREQLPEWMASVPIGLPMVNNELYLLDEYGRQVATGIIGEIYVGGIGVGRGYLQNPVQTASRFVPDSFSQRAGARLYRTGDLARWLPSGQLDFINRADHQIKIRGFRIELGEIEFHARQQPLVKDVAVIARGEAEQKYLVAYVVAEHTPNDGEEFDEKLFTNSISDGLKNSLPEYMVPLVFVRLDQLPLSSNGKIDRKALPDISNVDKSMGDLSLAETETEIVLEKLWCKILGVEKIGIDTSFFELGGHSLTAIRLVSACGEQFSRQLPIRSVYEFNTIRTLSTYIETLPIVTQQVISTVSRSKELPLSYAQQSMWLIDQIEEGSVQYNIPVVLKLIGELDVGVLSQAIDEIVYRHEVLRTTYGVVTGTLQQIIHEPQPLDVVKVDLRELTLQQQEAKISALREREAKKSFHLERDYPLRASLLRLKDQEYILLFTMHHIVSDAWSIDILVREFITLYGAFKDGQMSPLATLKFQYADYAYWQRTKLNEDSAHKELLWWKNSLTDAPPAHSLPLDYARPLQQNFIGNSFKTALDKSTLESIKDLAGQHNASLFMVLQTAFAVLIGRLSHSDQVVIGSPVAGRMQEDVGALIGLFVNTLAFHNQLAGDLSFCELLDRNREYALQAFENQNLPLEMIISHLQLERSLSYSPLFQIIFSLQNAPDTDFLLPGLEVINLEAADTNAKFDLILDAREAQDGVVLNWIYAESLFARETIERMANNFACLLQSIVCQPDISIKQLPLIEKAETDLLLQWQSEKHSVLRPAIDNESNIYQYFIDQVKKAPNATALVLGDQVMTYSTLETRARTLAKHLQATGILPGSMVGLCVHRSFDMVVGMLAILKIGAVYVPLDPSYPDERLAFMVNDGNLKFILTQSATTEKFAHLNVSVLLLDSINEEEKHFEENVVDLQVSSSDLAYVIYTSGSSGKPKGVMIEHKSVIDLVIAPNYVPLNERTVMLQISSIAFDAATFEIWGSLLNGGVLVLFAEPLIDIALLNRYLVKHAINTLFLTTGLFEQWSHQEPESPSLRWLLTGGEKGNLDFVRRVYKNNPALNVIHVYGPTENTTFSCYCPLPREIRSMPIGRSVSGTQVFLLTGGKTLAAIGEIGELYLGGNGLARGYLNQAELTAEKFIHNPLPGYEGDCLYKTGDLMRWLANGSLEFIGRVDQQTKIRGFRIEPGEVEEQLNLFPDIKECFVSVKGEHTSEKILVAWLVMDSYFENESNLVENVREYLVKKLPDYMIPGAFIIVDKLPLNLNGKIDVRALPDPHFQLQDYYEAPVTVTENKLSDIWVSILGVEKISIAKKFFYVGGNSLLATRIVTEIIEVFDIDFPLRYVFEYQTIKEIAHQIDLILIRNRNNSVVDNDENAFEIEI